MGNEKIEGYYQKMAQNIQSATETRNRAKDFSKYDIALLKQMRGVSKTLLDLGSGTGLLISHLVEDFQYIEAVEKYPNFSKFISQVENITIFNEDILDFETDHKYDVISLFGVMNYFDQEQANIIYIKVMRFLKDDGVLVVKHQMGIEEDVVVDGYSKELESNYFSEYRWIKKERELLRGVGFGDIETIDIYPPEYNRWDNTHFYALVCKK